LSYDVTLFTQQEVNSNWPVCVFTVSGLGMVSGQWYAVISLLTWIYRSTVHVSVAIFQILFSFVLMLRS